MASRIEVPWLVLFVLAILPGGLLVAVLTRPGPESVPADPAATERLEQGLTQLHEDLTHIEELLEERQLELPAATPERVPEDAGTEVPGDLAAALEGLEEAIRAVLVQSAPPAQISLHATLGDIPPDRAAQAELHEHVGGLQGGDLGDLFGWTRADVYAALGKPDEVYTTNGQVLWSYVLPDGTDRQVTVAYLDGVVIWVED